MRGKLIVIEGTDGTGKTTLVGGLCGLRQAEIMKTPSAKLAFLRSVIEEDHNIQLRFFFYLNSCQRFSDEAEEILESGRNVICDRYVLTTLAYQAALGVDIEIVNLERMKLITPDLTLYLTLNEDTRAERVKQRRRSQHDGWIEDDQNLLRKVDAEYRKLGFGNDKYRKFQMVEFPMDGLNPEDAAKKASHFIDAHFSSV